MLLIELAFQGLQGFDSLERIPLKAGLNVVDGLDAPTREALLDAFYHSIFPDSSRGAATERLADPAAASSRIAVTFHGRDKVTYRVVRKADSGAMKLYRFEADQKKYVLFSSTSQEVAQFTRVQQRLPDEVAYERLFMFGPKTMPSLGDRIRSRSGVALFPAGVMAPAGPGMPMHPQARNPSMMQQPPGAMAPAQVAGGFGSSLNMTNALVQSELAADEASAAPPAATATPAAPAPAKAPPAEKNAAALARLEKLRSELDRAQRGERAQDEVDQLNMRQFELTEATQQIEKLAAEIERLEAHAAEETALNDLPPGFGERLRQYEDLQKRHSDDLTRLEKETVDQEAERDSFRIVPLIRDPYFLAGLGLAVVSIAAAVLFEVPALALLNVLFALLAAGAVFRYLSELEQLGRFDVRINAIKERRERALFQHNLDTGAMTRLMQQLKIEDPSELSQRVEGHEKLLRQLDVARARRDELQMDPQIIASAKELEHLRRRVVECEADLASAQGLMLSAQALEVEVRALERKLGDAAPPRAQVVRKVLGTGDLPPPPLRKPAPRAGSHFPPPRVRPREASFVRTAPLAPPSGALPADFDRGSISLDLDLSDDVPAATTSSLPKPIVDLPPMPGPYETASNYEPLSLDDLSKDLPPPSAAARDARPRPTLPVPPAAPAASAREMLRPPRKPIRSASEVPTAIVRERDVSKAPQPQAQTLHRDTAPTGDMVIDASKATLVDPRGIAEKARASDQGRREARTVIRRADEAGVVIGPAPSARPPARPELERAAQHREGVSLGGDDEEDGYGSGYGEGYGGSESSEGSGGASTKGYSMSGLGSGGGFGGGRFGSSIGYPQDEGSAPLPDRSRDLVQIAIDLLQVEVDQFAETISDRLGQFLSALTDGKYTSATFGARGELSVQPADATPGVGYMHLDPSEIDNVDSALRLALLEAVSPIARVPIMIDDPFGGLSPKKRKLVRQMLTYLGQATQVVVLSAPAQE